MEVVGTSSLSDTLEVIFYLDNYKGVDSANIRKFVRSKRYTGPTRSGIKLAPEQLRAICETLQEAPIDANTMDVREETLVSIPLTQTSYLSANVEYYGGEYGLDIRQYFKTKKYKGPSKKGVRIPLDFLGDAVAYLHKMLAALDDRGKKETPLPEKESSVRIEPDRLTAENIEGVPDEYQEYF